MATAPPAPLASSVEKTNGAKLSRLLIDGGTTVLKSVFDRYYPPAKLAADLNLQYKTLLSLYRRRILNTSQWGTSCSLLVEPHPTPTLSISLFYSCFLPTFVDYPLLPQDGTLSHLQAISLLTQILLELSSSAMSCMVM